MKTLLLVLTFFAISASAKSAPIIYKCNMHEAFPRKIPAQVTLIVDEKTANIKSNDLKGCRPFEKLMGWQRSSGPGFITGAVNCATGTINLQFDDLTHSEINLKLSGDEYSYSRLGEANYICHLN